MNNIVELQLSQEAQNVLEFHPKARKCGGNKLKRKCNCYGLTLKYLFALKGFTYEDVGERLGISAQSVNHLVNRASEESFNDKIYLQSVCKKLNIDYNYFTDLCNYVRGMIE